MKILPAGCDGTDIVTINGCKNDVDKLVTADLELIHPALAEQGNSE